MPVGDFKRSFLTAYLPVSDDIATTYLIRSDDGPAVFFTVQKKFDLPAHAHNGQWHTVFRHPISLLFEPRLQ